MFYVKTIFLIITILFTLTACDIKSTTNSNNLEQIDTKQIPQKNSDDTIKICYTNWGIMGGDELPRKGAVSYIVSKVLENAGYKVEVDILNWTRCLDSTKNQDYDIVSVLWESKALSENFSFLNNSTIDKMYFYANINSGIDTGNMDSLKGKSVAIVRGAGGTEAFYSRENEFKVYRVATQKQALDMVLEGRADLTIAESRQFSKLLQDEYTAKASQIKKLYPHIQLNYGSPAMSKNHPRWKEISKKYNESYRQLVKDGLYEELESVFKAEFESRPLSQDGTIN